MATKDRLAGQIAETIVEDLRAHITDSNFQPRIWLARDHARIYTGSRAEYLRVYRDGRVERSQPRMSWGHLFDEVLKADALAAW